MKKSAKAVIIDILLIAMMILPLAACIVLKILFSPATEGITVTGAIIYFTIPMPIMDLPKNGGNGCMDIFTVVMSLSIGQRVHL